MTTTTNTTTTEKPASLAALQAQVAAPREAALPAIRTGFFDVQSFELMQRVSKAFAASDMVPAQYQGNLSNCMIALDMAERIGASPLMVMQNLYIVHGSPAWSSKFLIATVNACGRYSSMRYEWKGQPGQDDFGCRAWAIEKATGERLDGIWVTWAMVKAEGWNKKNGSKWNTMPDQMFIYRAAAFWQRAYAPELAMGLQTQEEVEDVIDVQRQPDGTYAADLETLQKRRPSEGAPASAAPAEAPVAEPPAAPAPEPAAVPVAAPAADDPSADELFPPPASKTPPPPAPQGRPRRPMNVD